MIISRRCRLFAAPTNVTRRRKEPRQVNGGTICPVLIRRPSYGKGEDGNRENRGRKFPDTAS